MSGDLGSSIVVEACEKFMQSHQDVELYVTGKAEELENYNQMNVFILLMLEILFQWMLELCQYVVKKDSSMVKAVTFS